MSILKYIWLLGLFGCAGFDGAAPRVIERSKAEPPYWIKKAQLTLMEEDKRFTYIELKSHFRNLPLGIKETQLSALNASELALKSKLMKSVRQVSENQLLAVKSKADLEALVNKNVHDSHSKNAAVGDIYYEKVFDKVSPELKEHYRVYVKVDYFKEHYGFLLKKLANDLKKSRKSDLRKLGKTLDSGIAQLLGH